MNVVVEQSMFQNTNNMEFLWRDFLRLCCARISQIIPPADNDHQDEKGMDGGIHPNGVAHNPMR